MFVASSRFGKDRSERWQVLPGVQGCNARAVVTDRPVPGVVNDAFDDVCQDKTVSRRQYDRAIVQEFIKLRPWIGHDDARFPACQHAAELRGKHKIDRPTILWKQVDVGEVQELA